MGSNPAHKLARNVGHVGRAAGYVTSEPQESRRSRQGCTDYSHSAECNSAIPKSKSAECNSAIPRALQPHSNLTGACHDH